MAAEFTIKQDDLAAVLVQTLRDGNGNPLDLSGCTVTFRMRGYGLKLADTLKISDAAATIIGGDGAQAQTATRGRVSYTWILGDTDTPGYFAGEWVVTFPGPKPLTSPSNGSVYVRITPNLGV